MQSVLPSAYKLFAMVLIGRVAQSVERLPTGWAVRGSNPVGDEIFRT
jgi:hypothetical protein